MIYSLLGYNDRKYFNLCCMKMYLKLLMVITITAIVSCNEKEKSAQKSEEKTPTDTAAKTIEAKIPTSCIALATPSLEASLAFWTKLGFEIVEQGTDPYPFAYICDGSSLIGLFEDGDTYLGFSMWVDNLNAQVKRFVDAGFLVDPDFADEEGMTVVITPDSLTGIALVTMENTFKAMRIKSMLQMAETDYGKEAAYPNPILGVFAEFSIPVADLDKSIAMWERASVNLFMKENYLGKSYAIMSDNELIIGLHQDADFNECAITYFAPDARTRIELVKKAGITQIKDLTDKMPTGGDKHFIITTPEGKQLFVFSMM